MKLTSLSTYAKAPRFSILPKRELRSETIGPGPQVYSHHGDLVSDRIRSKSIPLMGPSKPTLVLRQRPTPSPQDYRPFDGATRKGVVFSKAKRSEVVASSSNVPGPGSYSSYTPVFKVIWKPQEQFPLRFKENTEMTPGPGSFELPKASRKGCAFTKGKRPSMVRNGKFPGPASYSTAEERKGGVSLKGKTSRWLSEEVQRRGKQTGQHGPDLYISEYSI